MPHDKNGHQLGVGDLVLVPCYVVQVHSTQDHCNLSLETVEPMYPGTFKTDITLNTRQVELVLDNDR